MGLTSAYFVKNVDGNFTMIIMSTTLYVSDIMFIFYDFPWISISLIASIQCVSLHPDEASTAAALNTQASLIGVDICH